MRTIYYRLEGDRKYFSTLIEEVITYAIQKHKLSEPQISELKKYGTTQDGKIGIMQFFSK